MFNLRVCHYHHSVIVWVCTWIFQIQEWISNSGALELINHGSKKRQVVFQLSQTWTQLLSNYWILCTVTANMDVVQEDALVEETNQSAESYVFIAKLKAVQII